MSHHNHVLTGVIEKWLDHKGFGFIKSEHNKSIFFHISDFKPPRKPQVDEKVYFELHTDRQDRIKAVNIQEVSFVDKKQQQISKKNQQKQAKRQHITSHQQEFVAGQQSKLIGVGIAYVALLALALLTFLPWLVVGWYVVIGIITYCAYWQDKISAQNNAWRTPEKTLHTLSLVGGWGGAMIAQSYLRHKSKKQEFRIVYYLTIVGNIIGLCYIIITQPI